MRLNSILQMQAGLATVLATMLTSLSGADIVISSYDPPPDTLNGFVQIQPLTKVANQFTFFPNLSPTDNSIDQIRILFSSDTTSDELLNTEVAIYNENIIGNTPQPGSVVQVQAPPPATTPPTLVDLVFNQIVATSMVTIKNKNFLEVTYEIGPGIYQIFPPAETEEPVNYWLVVSNNNSEKGVKVEWAKTSSQDPIYNETGSASINPNTLNFQNNPDRWQPIGGGGGDGNQIMLFALVNAPEPSTYVLGSIVAGVLAMTARKPRLRTVVQRNEVATANS
jgi:hypothetical protein